MVVLAVDDSVVWLVSAALHFSGAYQTGVNGVTKFSHDRQIIQTDRLLLRFLNAEQFQISDPTIASFAYPLNEPESLVALLGGTPRQQHSHLVALTNWAKG